MTIKTVLFASCDNADCDESWPVPDHYRSTPVQFGSGEGVVDLCEKHQEEARQMFGYVLNLARAEQLSNSKTPYRSRGDLAGGEYQCICGRGFDKAQGLSMHIARTPGGGFRGPHHWFADEAQVPSGSIYWQRINAASTP